MKGYVLYLILTDILYTLYAIWWVGSTLIYADKQPPAIKFFGHRTTNHFDGSSLSSSNQHNSFFWRNGRISFWIAFVFPSLEPDCISWRERAVFHACCGSYLLHLPSSELLPLIRCPHPHFFAEGTDSQTLSATNPDFFSQKIFPKQGLISSDGGKCYCRTVGWVGAVVLNIVIFLQLHGGTRTVPQRGDVKTTNSRNSDEQQQELGNKNPS